MTNHVKSWLAQRARVKAAGAAESRYDSCAQATGARTSDIVRMLGPELLVDVPAALCERWAQGFEARAGTPRRATNPKTGGRGPEERSSSQVTPELFFNTAGAFKPVSLELYTVSAHVVRQPCLTSIARCPRSWLLSPYYVLTPSPFPSLVARLFGFHALQKMPANRISSELSAHQMAPAGVFAHSRAHLCPRASSLSFSSLVSPLRPLGSGLLGRGDPRYFIYFYAVTDAGPASHRVRLWQGGPASTC